jgi:hypothetical protein
MRKQEKKKDITWPRREGLMAMMVQPRGAAIEVANAVFEPRKQ